MRVQLRILGLLVVLACLGGSGAGWPALRATAQTAPPEAPDDLRWIGPPGPWTVDRLAATPDGRIIVARRSIGFASREELVRTVDAGATWERIPFPEPYTDYPNRHAARLRLVLAQHGNERVLLFSTGNRTEHVLLRSTDLGSTWLAVANVPTTEFEKPELVLSPSFETDGIGLLVTEGQLHRTADGGRTWAVVAQPADRQIRSAAFSPRFSEDPRVLVLLRPLDPYDSSLVAAPPMVLASADGGASWSPLPTDPLPTDLESPMLSGIWFGPPGSGASSLLALIGSHAVDRQSSRLLRSEDGGTSWSIAATVPLQPGWGTFRLAFSPRFPEDGAAVLAAEFGCQLVRTGDGGATWTPASVTIPESDRCNDGRHLIHDGTAFLVGFDANTSRQSFDSRWLRSGDSGASWQALSPEGTQVWIGLPMPSTGGMLLGSTTGIWASGGAAASIGPVDPQISCREQVDGAIGAVWAGQPDARRGLGCPLDAAQPAWIRELRDDGNGVTSYWIDGADRDWYRLADGGRWAASRKHPDAWPGRADETVTGRAQRFEGGLTMLLPRTPDTADVLVLTEVDRRWRRYPAQTEAATP